LLVFDMEKSESARESAQSVYGPWISRWQNFKTKPPHQEFPYSKRNWGHPLHSLCSYQGKLKPALAHFLVETFAPKAGNVLDPFAGVGTIPFEAALSGRKSWSFDISPAALTISRAKLCAPNPKDCVEQIKLLAEYLATESIGERDKRSTKDIHFNGEIQDYFHPKTFKEILLARRFFLDNHAKTDAGIFILAALLHILHGNRPYALSRRSHPITPFAPTGPSEYRPLIPRLEDKVARSLENPLPSDFQKGSVFDQDATACWPMEINNIDAIITSPPFFDSTRFYLANWMRLWFCGWGTDDFKTRPLAYIDERQKKDMSVYKPFFRQARERLRTGGVLVLHLGKSRKCDMAEHLKLIARPWFHTLDLFEESVAHCESHGIADKGTVEKHQYLVLG